MAIKNTKLYNKVSIQKIITKNKVTGNLDGFVTTCHADWASLSNTARIEKVKHMVFVHESVSYANKNVNLINQFKQADLDDIIYVIEGAELSNILGKDLRKEKRNAIERLKNAGFNVTNSKAGA